MLGSIAYGASDRRSRRSATKRSAMSSRVSLLSAVTASSSGSSGSGSTITQESISRPRSKPSKGKRAPDMVEHTPATAVSASRKSRGGPGVDVFAFLDKNQSRASLSQKPPLKRATSNHDDSKASVQEDSDVESNGRSFHSDSGISINDTASDHESPKITGTSRDSTFHPPTGDHSARHQRPYQNEQRYQPKLQPIPHMVEEDSPEWYYWTGASPDGTDMPFAPEIGPPSSERLEQPTLSGYDLLATSLCSSRGAVANSVPPLYRRFEKLNHRILLQLQDEIAEMEEDLHHMDQADAWERTAQDGRPMPASRRMDWKWRGSELHARRLDLLGRIYVKVEQYNQALASYMKVASSTTSASSEDMENYRMWMGMNNPVTPCEATYLDQENDLLSLTTPRRSATLPSILSNSSTAVIAIASATALPILLFCLLPGLVSRLSVILLLAPSIVLIPKSFATATLLDEPESRCYVFVYLGGLMLAALVI